MREYHDQYSKEAISVLLRPAGPVEEQMAVKTDAQYVDIHFRPGPDAASRLGLLGLLGKLVDRPSSLEHFHRTPDGAGLLECVRKHLNHRHHVGLARPLPLLPRLWVLSSGRPDDSLRGLGLRRVHGLPRGVYGSPPLYDFGVVAINELCEHPSTLLLRLLGTGRTFRRALDELRSLPPDAIEVQTMLPVVVRYYRMADGAEHKTDDQKEFLMETQEIVREWEQRLREEGEKEGEKKGEKKGREEGEKRGREAAASTILVLYELRFGGVPERVRTRIQGESDLAVLAAWTELIARQPQEIVERALNGGKS